MPGPNRGVEPADHGLVFVAAAKESLYGSTVTGIAVVEVVSLERVCEPRAGQNGVIALQSFGAEHGVLSEQ